MRHSKSSSKLGGSRELNPKNNSFVQMKNEMTRYKSNRNLFWRRILEKKTNLKTISTSKSRLKLPTIGSNPSNNGSLIHLNLVVSPIQKANQSGKIPRVSFQEDINSLEPSSI